MVQWSVDAAAGRGRRRRARRCPPATLADATARRRAAAGADVVVAGGDTRAASVRAGLAAVPAAAEVIVVHDGARPWRRRRCSGPWSTPCGRRRRGRAGAGGGRHLEARRRRRRASPPWSATGSWRCRRPRPSGPPCCAGPTTGGRGHRRRRAGRGARRYRARRARRPAQHQGDHGRRPRGRPGPGGVVTDAGAGPAGLRVGQGFDVHRFSGDPGRPLVLGGVTIPGAAGLAGHSDADVVAHAVADALLGAAGLGDLGRHFPASDPGLGRRRLHGAAGPGVVDGASAGHGGSSTPTAPWSASVPGWPSTPTTWRVACSDLLGAPVSVKAKRAEGLGASAGSRASPAWPSCCSPRRVSGPPRRRRTRPAPRPGDRPSPGAERRGHRDAAADGRRDGASAAGRGATPGAGGRSADRGASVPGRRTGAGTASAASRSRVARPCASCSPRGAVRCARSGSPRTSTRPRRSTTSSAWRRAGASALVLVPRTKLDRAARTDAPQGVLAHARPLEEIELDTLCRARAGDGAVPARARRRDRPPQRRRPPAHAPSAPGSPAWCCRATAPPTSRRR